MIFMKQKYTKIVQYHKKVGNHLDDVAEDYQQCKQIITENQLVKRKNREKHYIPLLELTNRRYNFMLEQKVTENGQVFKKKVIESIYVPKKTFYKQPIKKRLLWITILLVFVQAICNYGYIIFV